MRIVQLATEFAPIAKAGGLGEVILGLSRELKRTGHEIEIILPKYDFIDMKSLRSVNLEVPDFKCFEKGKPHANAMWAAECEGLSLHLLDARHPAGYFHRGKIYGCEDDTSRFLYYSRAAIEYLAPTHRPIDVLHLHDWPVAAAALFVRDLFKLPVKTIVITIHNAAYQGKCAPWDLDYIGLNSKLYLTKEKLQDASHPELINLLKGGLLYSDIITTVSPTYAKEILTPEMGYGLEPIFRERHARLHGILNGLDLKFWDPATDPLLSLPYKSGDAPEKILSAKAENRRSLAKRLNLPDTHRPWVGAITRLAHQKGPELIEVAIEETLRLGGTFLLLGSGSPPALQSHFEKLREKLKGKPIYFLFAYDEALAHQVYAALDFLVLPSLYEPCGLAQMIAMRYGTIPIARATGGHLDTIIDKKNGFLFPDFTAASEKEAIGRAVRLFKESPSSLSTLIQNGMARDWSWKNAAQEYARLFQKTLT
jgi:starch synthase